MAVSGDPKLFKYKNYPRDAAQLIVRFAICLLFGGGISCAKNASQKEIPTGGNDESSAGTGATAGQPTINKSESGGPIDNREGRPG